ncbi:MAG: response regulator transcription factor [Verrucomicrobia bacterium]|nr:response regulator transcription factor [Verrucomicrobiota bacterium]
MNGSAVGGRRIRTLVVDDDPLMRIAIRLLLERDRSIHVVGTAGDGHQGYLLANSLRPDLVLSDLHMPEVNGLAFTGMLSREFPETRVIIVTNDTDPALSDKCRAEGAHGFVTKDQLWNELSAEIKRVFQTATPPAVGAAKMATALL